METVYLLQGDSRRGEPARSPVGLDEAPLPLRRGLEGERFVALLGFLELLQTARRQGVALPYFARLRFIARRAW
jgi:hypothetical protein